MNKYIPWVVIGLVMYAVVITVAVNTVLNINEQQSELIDKYKVEVRETHLKWLNCQFGVSAQEVEDLTN